MADVPYLMLEAVQRFGGLFGEELAKRLDANFASINPGGITIPLPIAQGGSGATTATTALLNFGLSNTGVSLVTSGSAAQMRTVLGLIIGADVQAFDADLQALASLTGTNTIYYRSAPDTWSPVTIGAGLSFTGGTLTATGGGGGSVDSFNGRTGVVTLLTADVTAALGYTPLRPSNNLSDLANPATARTNLGLGTAATQASTAFAASGGITASGLTMTTARLLGRTTASTGAVEEISVGSGLSLSGGTLSATGGGGGAQSNAQIADSKASGTASQTMTAGGWSARQLQTEVFDPDGIVTIAANRFTLAAGTYRITARGGFSSSSNGFSLCRNRIQNITDGVTVGVGPNCTTVQASTPTVIVTAQSDVDVVFTIAGSKQFEFQGYVSTTNCLLGSPISSGDPEIYSTVNITKLA